MHWSQLFTNQFVVHLNIISYEQNQHSTCSIELILYIFFCQFLFIAIFHKCSFMAFDHYLNWTFSTEKLFKWTKYFIEILVLLNVRPNERFPHENYLNGYIIFKEIVLLLNITSSWTFSTNFFSNRLNIFLNILVLMN